MSSPHDPNDPVGQQPGWGQAPQQPGWGHTPQHLAGPYPNAWPPGSGYALPPQQHPSAGTAMGVSLFALIGGMACGLPLFAAPFAWVIGARALREIDENPQHWSGRDMANTGRIIGIVGTVILLLAFVAAVILVGVVLVAG